MGAVVVVEETRRRAHAHTSTRAREYGSTRRAHEHTSNHTNMRADIHVLVRVNNARAIGWKLRGQSKFIAVAEVIFYGVAMVSHMHVALHHVWVLFRPVHHV